MALCVMPVPVAIARSVADDVSVTGHGLEHEGDEVVGNPVVE